MSRENSLPVVVLVALLAKERLCFREEVGVSSVLGATGKHIWLLYFEQ